jgi:hypothetical protein
MNEIIGFEQKMKKKIIFDGVFGKMVQIIFYSNNVNGISVEIFLEHTFLANISNILRTLFALKAL